MMRCVDRNMFSQFWMRCHTLSLMKEKIWVLFLPARDGRPEYCPSVIDCWTPKILLTSYRACEVVFALNEMEDLWELIYWSDARSYRLMHMQICWLSSRLALKQDKAIIHEEHLRNGWSSPGDLANVDQAHVFISFQESREAFCV